MVDCPTLSSGGRKETEYGARLVDPTKTPFIDTSIFCIGYCPVGCTKTVAPLFDDSDDPGKGESIFIDREFAGVCTLSSPRGFTGY